MRPPQRRADTAGKFLTAGDATRICGVTYGSFRPHDGAPFPPTDVVAEDFRAMAAVGANAVRTYSVPPRWLLDLAEENGLLVMVGLAWEAHVAFLEDRTKPRAIIERLRAELMPIAGHPAILCYAVGNEIPAPIVRWHGRRRIETFLERLCALVRTLDPQALVTYVNYPSTEYLQLPFLDVVAFNVYLESTDKLELYLARLQNLAGDRPLIVAELGLDSQRHGELVQGIMLERQIETTFAAGCAGAFVFAWTDEWHRGGADIEDWSFGLTDSERRPKAALARVMRAFWRVPVPAPLASPLVSVILCSWNGAPTIREALEGIARLDYPSYEVIVVDDGSTDGTAEIAYEYGATVVASHGAGLSEARNAGVAAARGEIVAFIDDDAWPERAWLTQLVATFASATDAGVGGPNIPPASDSIVETAVAQAPGGPIHVLLSDTQAEHLPGCNMAFRRDALIALGGFDPQFKVAGDDVDICWRILERGWTLGYSPGAMVWHRRRSTIGRYFDQQREYGKAEALLERKWPEKYNRGGHVAWSGRVYGGVQSTIGRRWRVYYGTWASGLFQSLYQRAPTIPGSSPLMPEWYLLLAVLGVTSILDAMRQRLLLPGVHIPFQLPLFVAGAATVLVAAIRGARAASRERPRLPRRRRLVALTAFLFLLQPLARLWGRLGNGLTPWRRRGRIGFDLPVPHEWTRWSERWVSQQDRLGEIKRRLRPRAMLVLQGGDFDRWDLLVRVGPLGAARLRVAVEEHGQGKQLLRLRIWPLWTRWIAVLLVPLGLWSGLAVTRDSVEAVIVATAALIVVARAIREAGAAVALLHDAVDRAESLPIEGDEHATDPSESELIAVAEAVNRGDRGRDPNRVERNRNSHVGARERVEQH